MTRWSPDIVYMAKKKILDLRSRLASARETETSKSKTPPTKKDRIDKSGHMPKSKPKIYFMTLHKKNYWQSTVALKLEFTLQNTLPTPLASHPSRASHGSPCPFPGEQFNPSGLQILRRLLFFS